MSNVHCPYELAYQLSFNSKLIERASALQITIIVYATYKYKGLHLHNE